MKYQNTQFGNYIMHGSMVKKVNKVKFFQKTAYPIRYFIIDYTSAVMHIKHNKDDAITDKNTKQVHFRDIKDVRMPSEEIEKQIRNKDSLVNWKYPFFVDTVERPF